MRQYLLIPLVLAPLAVPAGTAHPGPIDEAALERLHQAAAATHSDAVVLLQDGKTLAEWYFGEERRPIQLMSVVKSVVSLGIGRLLALEKIDSLDQPVHEFYPEWKQGRKKDITLRHLLNHTSGLQDHRSAGMEIYPSPDAVKLALAAELSEDPGSAFRYNNKATNLLSGIIERAYGQRMDQFFAKELFDPMGIEQHQWYYDQSGTPHAMAGLELHARDLAKLGQLVLDDGHFGGEALIEESYVEEMLAQSQPHYFPYGLLWWRMPRQTVYILDEAQLGRLREAGVASADLARIRPLLGQSFRSRSERDAALEEELGAEWRTFLTEHFPDPGTTPLFRREYGEIVAYYGDGYLGQTLMVVPEHSIVAVRQVAGDEEYDPSTDGFREFKNMVLDLIDE